MSPFGTVYTGWRVAGEWPGDEKRGSVVTGDNHPDDWKPKVVVTEAPVAGSKRPNVEIVIESKPEI